MSNNLSKSDSVSADEPERSGPKREKILLFRRNLLLWGGILVVYGLLRVNPLGISLTRDEGVYAHMGQIILSGELPYLDLVDNRPPIVFYLYALNLALFSPTTFGVHLFLHLYNFLTLVVLFLVATRLFASRWAGIGCAYLYAVLSSSPAVEGYGATAEMYMLLPISLSLMMALKARDSCQVRYTVISGVAGALACWTKQPAFTCALFVLIFAVLAGSEGQSASGRWRKMGKSAAAWLAGALGVSLLIAGYFSLCGAF